MRRHDVHRAQVHRPVDLVSRVQPGHPVAVFAALERSWAGGIVDPRLGIAEGRQLVLGQRLADEVEPPGGLLGLVLEAVQAVLKQAR